MYIDIIEYYEKIQDYFDEEQQSKLYDIFTSLKFKLKKNKYHLKNIEEIVSSHDLLDNENFYEEIHLPIYYEVESFLVSLRSSVDILLHIVNFAFDLNLNISKNEVTLYNVFHHKKLPKSIKNIFERYTRPYNNPTWNFIYTNRNEIVHEKSIDLVLPINIDLFNYSKPMLFFEWEGNDKEMIDFFHQCVRFLDNFSNQFLQSIEISL